MAAIARAVHLDRNAQCDYAFVRGSYMWDSSGLKDPSIREAESQLEWRLVLADKTSQQRRGNY